jgi:hypothetical protein
LPICRKTFVVCIARLLIVRDIQGAYLMSDVHNRFMFLLWNRPGDLWIDRKARCQPRWVCGLKFGFGFCSMTGMKMNRRKGGLEHSVHW